MKKPVIYGIWAVLYFLCLGLGFINEAGPFGKTLLVSASLLFFVPPAYLTWLGAKQTDWKLSRNLGILSLCVLGLSLIFLILNFLSVNFSSQAGLVLHVLLAMVSVPMFCGQQWALGLFLWACLMIVNFKKRRSNPA